MNIDKSIKWNKKKYNELLEYLVSIGEESYKTFNLKLVTSKYDMIGIRIPILRKIANKISKTDYLNLLDLFNDDYFEVVLLEGLLISYIEDYDAFIKRFKEYVKKVDNWAICDTVTSSIKIVNKFKDKFLELVSDLIKDKYEFSKRFGFVILLDYYVEKEYLSIIFQLIESCKSDDYYVNMAISWLLCECYVKYCKETYQFILSTDLSEFVLRKTVSKVNDSFRVSKEDKERLRDLRIKS